ncbi:carbohydrate ABC transporter permease [Ruania rhizosphaerae]|uniref:carbohydrate ABC transporter permease n=1 Tax=Ruania rhizosphaerae TaxID=1840413 RepID=UPI00135719AC|nr:sugar ABC transporter permease [Ruania rhizosphaerae]
MYISFTNRNLGYSGERFIGFDNYVRLFNWEPLPTVLTNTALFVGAVVILQLGTGLGIALLLNQKFFGRKLVRSIAIVPWIVPGVIIAIMFQQIFGASELGIANAIMVRLGFDTQNWLADPTLAMTIMILSVAWRGIPLTIILQLGGLQTIPKDLYEAAKLDGAKSWQTLWHVVIPSLRPILLINAIMATSGTLNHIDIPLTLTGGGPARATEVISVSLYQQGFELLDAGYAASIGTVILVLNLVLTLVYLRIWSERRS